MTGDRRLVRIGTHAADEGACPERLAIKARPAMQPAQRSRARGPFLENFPLKAVMAVVDKVEFHGRNQAEALEQLGREGKPMHPGAIRWGRHAAASYLNLAVSVYTVATMPVPHYWVVQHAGNATSWELYAWGRRYESPDGSVREFRFIRFGVADGNKRDKAQVAIAAYSAAFGVPAPWPDPWREPFRPIPREHVDVRRVRVLEIGLEGGEPDVLFDGTPQEAEAYYAEHARARVGQMSKGGTRQPGWECADCKLATACEALTRIPGMLGIADPTASLRTWSVTDGRYYRVCPAQEHLIRLNLPKENEYTESAIRGQAVHAWLEENHRGPFHTGCSIWDIPSPPDDWSVGKWRVTGEQALAGSRMLANHADLCPFQRADQIAEVRLEPTLAFHDTAANVIVIAKPDMLYMEAGAWVWREIKTRQRLPRSGTDLFQDFPQLALATVLLAEHALGGKPSGSRIELEFLTPDASDIPLIDPNDPAEVAKARAVVRELAQPWHADKTAAARPGPHCTACPVRRWCPDAWTEATT
jgi:hypothetical protein